MIICTYEDRPSDLVGVQLLVSSLARHVPGVPVHVACPAPGAELARWLRASPGVTLDETRDDRLRGWNVKAGLLTRLLDAGHEEVLWIDSDVIVAGDFRSLIPDATSLVVTEELSSHGPKEARLRTEGWNLPVGRALPHIVNSAFLRVTRAHRPLLDAWIALMLTDAYQEAQRLPFAQRPTHMISDQDVLCALLGAQAFAHLPVTFLARGRDIIHDISGGYTPLQRLANLFRPMPPLVHAQGAKPWRYPDVPRLLREPARYYRFTQVESSPYTHVARAYRSVLPSFPEFLEVRSLPAKVAGALAFGNPHIHGLAYAIVDEATLRLHRARLLAMRASRRATRALKPKLATRGAQ
jgi:hypothetical protein